MDSPTSSIRDVDLTTRRDEDRGVSYLSKRGLVSIACSIFLALWMLFWTFEALNERRLNVITLWAVERNILVMHHDRSDQWCYWEAGRSVCHDQIGEFENYMVPDHLQGEQ